jgi:hypothetical protein
MLFRSKNSLVLVVGCIVMLTICLGWNDAAVALDPSRFPRKQVKTKEQVSSETANDTDPAVPGRKEQSPRSEGREAEVESTSESAASEAKSAPLKDFRPTEEIAADTAVDFPADI